MGFGKWWKQSPVTTISNIGSSVDDAVLQPIGNVVEGTLKSIEDDPLKAAAIALAVGTGNSYLVPYIQGGAALANGASPEDALKQAAISYTIQNVAAEVMAPEPNAVGGVTGPDNIDVGGGFNPAAGATTAELEAVRLALEPVVTPTINDITNEIAAPPVSNPVYDYTEPPVSNPVYDYGDATPAEITSAKAEMAAKGLSFKDALDYVRAGLFVNAITGDPLGLSGNTGGGGGAGFTGFEQVPIPAEWKSPTYAASSAPIDLSSIFTDKNLLAGTQWQGLPQQQNVSFNDIFASGQQRTPMGQPVDINQIVSAILGQNATSQKPA